MSDRRLLLKAIILLGLMLAADCTCAQERERINTIAELMEQMTAGKFRHLPVVDQGRLIGIVSIGDVVKLRLEEMQHDTQALQDYIRTA